MHRLLAAAAVPAVVGLFYLYDPATTAWFPSCPFRALTGLLCPLCGSLRAAHALAHGHLGEAFLLNPLTLVLGALFVVERAAGPTFGSGAPGGGGKLGPAFAAAALFTVLRNLP